MKDTSSSIDTSSLVISFAHNSTPASHNVSSPPQIISESNEPFLKSLNPSTSNILIHHIDDDISIDHDRPTSKNNKITAKLPLRESGPIRTLRLIRKSYPNSFKASQILRSWIPKPRWPEINDSLIRSLCFLDHDLALNVLAQLKDERFIIAGLTTNGRKRNSVKIQSKISIPPLPDDILDIVNLLDCGATKDYIHEELVLKKGWNTDPLPHPIPVYNADGTINSAGMITHTIELDIQIQDHVERRRFAITNIGDSDIILGYAWLWDHNPLVDWKSGDICFSRCPAKCHSISKTITAPLTPISPFLSITDSGPDYIRKTTLHETTLDETPLYDDNLSWEAVIKEELADGELMLCIDILPLEDEYVRSINTKDSIDQSNETRRQQSSDADKYIKEFTSVFEQKDFDRLPPERPWDHAIELKPDSHPITSKIYPLSKSEQIELDTFIEEQLRTGRIRPSKSPIASPFFFVKKKDGALRPVQDYRKLNEMTIRNQYPLPLVSELMDKLKGAKYFTKLDVRWGFNNIRIKKGDEHKAAFITNRGLFEPLVMFFGLTNSPATFQCMMNDLFKDLILQGHVIVYMDDILIFTNDRNLHAQITRQVLHILQDNNLYLKPEKCEFDQLEVEYLGVIISEGQIRMSPKKVDAVAQWPTPKSKKDVQQFLGFVNFYRRFVRNFADLATPLHALTGSAPWKWSHTEDTSFKNLRDAVISGPVLTIPLDDAPFKIEADSSGYATGAVLSQLQDDQWRPIAFYSKTLNEVERNYDIHDRELLSIMRSLADWRRYILGTPTPVDIISDHQNLQYFMKAQHLNRRQARWSLELADYSFTLTHNPGSRLR